MNFDDFDDFQGWLAASLRRTKSPVRDVGPAQSTEIQAEIDEKIRALRGVRNKHSPIFKLQTELLLTVFKFLAWDPPDDRDWSLWPSINHICRAWRSLALNSPSLWQKIVLPLEVAPSLPLFSEMVRLSGDLPLTIIQNFNWEDTGRSKDLPVVRFALQQAPRLEALQLELSREDMDACKDLLLQPFPLLRFFCLCGYSTYLDGLWQCPDNIFGKRAPLLRTMELYHCLPSSISPVMSHLTSLLVLFKDFPRICIFQLLAGLRNLPMLETLELNVRNSSKETHDILSQNLNKIYLSNLRQLTFSGDIESSRILKRIACPNITTFTVRDGIFDDEMIPESRMEGILHVTKFIGSRFSSAKSLSFRYQETKEGYGWNIDLHVESNSDVNAHVLNLRLGFLSFVLEEEAESFYPPERLAAQIFDALSLSRLDKLKLLGTPGFTIEHWDQLFARMPGLERIEIDSNPALLQMLADFENDRIFPPPNVFVPGDPEVRARTPFPDLQRLKLGCWDFGGLTGQSSANLWTRRLGERLWWVESCIKWYDTTYEAVFRPLDLWDRAPDDSDEVDS